MNYNNFRKGSGSTQAFVNANSKIIDGIDKDEAKNENKSFAFDGEGLKARASKSYSKLYDRFNNSEGMQNFKNADATAKAYKEGKYFENQSGSIGSNFLFKIAGMAGLQQELVMGLAPVITNAIEQTNNPLMKKFLGTTFGGLLQAQEANRIGERKKLVNNILEIFKPLGKAGKLAFEGIAITAQFIKDKTVEASSLVVNSVDDFIANALTNTGFLAPFLKVMYPFIKSTFMSVTKTAWNLGTGIIKKTGSMLFGSLVSRFFKTNKTVENAAKDRLAIVDSVKLVSQGLDFANKHLGLQSSKLDAINDTLKAFSGDSSSGGFSFSAVKDKFFSGSTRDMSDTSDDAFAVKKDKSKLHSDLDQNDVDSTFDGMEGSEKIKKKKSGFFSKGTILGGAILGTGAAAIYANSKRKSKDEPVEADKGDQAAKEENRGFFHKILNSLGVVGTSTSKSVELEEKQIKVAEETLEEEKKQNKVNMSEQILDRRKKDKHDQAMLDALKSQKGTAVSKDSEEKSFFDTLIDGFKNKFKDILFGGAALAGLAIFGPIIGKWVGGLIEESFNKVKNNLLEKILGVSANNTDGSDRSLSAMMSESLFGTKSNPTKFGKIFEFLGGDLEEGSPIQIDKDGNQIQPKSQNELGFQEYALGGVASYLAYKFRKVVTKPVELISKASTAIASSIQGMRKVPDATKPPIATKWSANAPDDLNKSPLAPDTKATAEKVKPDTKTQVDSSTKATAEKVKPAPKTAKKLPVGKKGWILAGLAVLGISTTAKADDLENFDAEDYINNLNTNSVSSQANKEVKEFMGVELADNSTSIDNVVQLGTTATSIYGINKGFKDSAAAKVNSASTIFVDSKGVASTNLDDFNKKPGLTPEVPVEVDSKLAKQLEVANTTTLKNPPAIINKVDEVVPEKKGFFGNLIDKSKNVMNDAKNKASAVYSDTKAFASEQYTKGKNFVANQYDKGAKAVGNFIDNSPMLQSAKSYVDNKIELAKKYGAKAVDKALDTKWGRIAKVAFKVASKIFAKLIPGVGWALLAYDLISSTMDVWENYDTIMKSQGLNPAEYNEYVAKIALIIGKTFWGDSLGAWFIKAYGAVKDYFSNNKDDANPLTPNSSDPVVAGPSSDLPSENGIRDEVTMDHKPIDSNSDLSLDSNNPLATLIPENNNVDINSNMDDEWARFNANADFILGLKGNNHDGRGSSGKFAGPTGNTRLGAENYSLQATKESDILAGRDGNFQSGVSRRYKRSNLGDTNESAYSESLSGVALENAIVQQKNRRVIGYNNVQRMNKGQSPVANSTVSAEMLASLETNGEFAMPQGSASNGWDAQTSFVADLVKFGEHQTYRGSRYSDANRYKDEGGITFGAYGFTSKSGSLQKFLKGWYEKTGDNRAKVLMNMRPWPTSKEFDAKVLPFLREIGNNEYARSLQDKIWKESYYDPAKQLATSYGFGKNPNVVANTVDMNVTGGAKNFLQALKKSGDLSTRGIAEARMVHYNNLATSDPAAYGHSLKGWANRVGNFNRNLSNSSKVYNNLGSDASLNSKTDSVATAPQIAPESKTFASLGQNNTTANKPSVSKVDYRTDTISTLQPEGLRTSSTQQDTLLQEGILSTTNTVAMKENAKEQATAKTQKDMNNTLVNALGIGKKDNVTANNNNNVVAPVMVANTTNINHSNATSVSGQHTAYKSTGNDISAR